MSKLRHALATLFALGSMHCSEESGPPTDTTPCGGPTPEERAANQKIFDGLAPTCEGCHASGSRGYFASIEAFESLVVYEPKLVVPGSPDGSELVRVLEGNGTRAFEQMPIAGPNFAELAADGQTTITMAEIRAWVTTLEARAIDPLPALEARRVTRIGADDVVRALYQQLGLSDEDFFIPGSNYSIVHKSTGQSDEKYPISSPDTDPAPIEDLPVERFASLGGGSAALQLKADGTVAPSFVGTLSQVAQRWCAIAIDKPNNAALLPAGTSATTGSADADAVKTVLRHWFLHFHAVVASDLEVDGLFESVFLPLEADTDARTAYVGTCSYFIRHPHWVFY